MLKTLNKTILSQSFHPDAPTKNAYIDTTAKKGQEYSYFVVPYNEVSCAPSGSLVTILIPANSSDSFAEELRDDVNSACFISLIN